MTPKTSDGGSDSHVLALTDVDGGYGEVQVLDDLRRPADDAVPDYHVPGQSDPRRFCEHTPTDTGRRERSYATPEGDVFGSERFRNG